MPVLRGKQQHVFSSHHYPEHGWLASHKLQACLAHLSCVSNCWAHKGQTVGAVTWGGSPNGDVGEGKAAAAVSASAEK